MSDNNVTIARFRLCNYLIANVSAKFSGNKPNGNMVLSVSPEGEFNLEKKIFNLILNIDVHDQEGNVDIKMLIYGYFEYDITDLDKLRPFISKNSTAILFPYIRAYISNISALSGMQPIIMPTLNLAKVGEELLRKLEEKRDHPQEVDCDK